MSAEPTPHLRLVDHETGELVECPACKVKDDEIAGLQRDIRGWAARYADLKRDKYADAKKSPHWPAAVRVFAAWQAATGHSRAAWNADRFWLIEPHIAKHGEHGAMRAVAGAAFDPFITTRRNGTKKRHDGWELLTRDAGKFEEFMAKAPIPKRQSRGLELLPGASGSTMPQPLAAMHDEPPAQSAPKKPVRRSYRSLMRLPAWGLFDAADAIVASMRATTAQEARDIFKAHGLVGTRVRRLSS